MIPASRENGVSQIPYSPLAQGVLTGKYTPGATRRRRDARRGARRSGCSSTATTSSSASSACARSRTASALSMAQLALAWILREQNVASRSSARREPDQLRDNAGASGVTLDDATLRAIDDALAAC